MSQEIMIISCVFGAVAMIGFFVSTLVVGNKDSGKVRNRLMDRGDEEKD